uniref:BAH domain-containing protein n=1 Tax=Hanusia phi TaxID=3032 RepID=A0A7S0E1Q1_9CRYP|mmetsp:Transcript_13277/g.30546  ORF Transcript_13277/g.30546 Transcript_13277/m.30546 type:complete len:617 (+) Transcript_13277:65-1915(+)
MTSVEDEVEESSEIKKLKKHRSRKVWIDEDTSRQDEEADEEASESPRFTLGLPLRSKSGELVKVKLGNRRGAQLYESITTSRREYKLLDDCFVEAEKGSMPFLGKIVAIGEGGPQQAVEEFGRYFVILYWYYQAREISKQCIERYRKKGIDLERHHKCILLSFHMDEVSPDALRKPFKVYFSKVEPKDPELHLKEPFDWCCSYVWDARGQENDNLSSGELHSMADSNYCDSPTKYQQAYGLQSIQHFVHLCCEKFPYPYPVQDYVYTQLDSKKGPKKLKVNPLTKEPEKGPKTKGSGSESPLDKGHAGKKRDKIQSPAKKRPHDGSAGTEQDAKRPKMIKTKALGLKNKPRHPIPSQPNVHSSEVKKFSDVKPKIDPKLEARILEVTKITRTPAKMKDVDWAFQELETAIESRSSSRITHEMRTMGKMKIFPLILNLTQAPVRLQAALQKIKPLGFEDAMREGEAILENWHLSIGKYMTKQNIVTGDYDGRQQLISLADKANVRKIGLKLAEKFITVKAIPLLSEAIWKQIAATKNERYRILSALPLELQSLIEGGIDAWKPQTGGRTSKVHTSYDQSFVSQQLVRVELRLQDLFSKAVDKVSESLTALTADPSSL